MATFKAQNIDLNIPEEGQLFKVKGEENTPDPLIYKRTGEQQIAIPKSLLSSIDYNSLPTYNPGDVRSALGQVAVIRDASRFGENIIAGQNISAMDQTLRAQGLPMGSAVPGLTVGANIVNNPQIAPTSTLGVVAQGIADVQNRINALGTKPISTQALTQNGTTPFVSPATPTIPPNTTTAPGGIYSNQGTSTTETSATLTQEEKDAQTISERLQKINDELAGKSAYTLEQQKALGVNDTQDKITNLISDINEITIQEKDIQNQINDASRAIQSQFFGRGATDAGVAPITAAAVRNLQGLSAAMASDRLAKEAQLALLQGNLDIANRKVAQAVVVKYAPLEAELAAKLANLKIIQKSPQYTADEKKQAAELQMQINAQQITIANAKQNQVDIFKVATDAAQNVARFNQGNTQYTTSNEAIQAIQNAKTKEEALNIAVNTGLTKSATDATLRAIADPITGEITYYTSKGIPSSSSGSPVSTGTPSGIKGGTPTGKTGIEAVNPLIKPAVETVLGQSYIDLSKLRDSEKALAAQSSNASGFPLLSQGDSDKVQAANQTYLAASTLINQLADLTKNVITADNTKTAMTAQAVKLKAIENFPSLSTNNDAKQFISARQSLLSLITRAAGEKGTLTDTDVNRIANALPSYGDNKELAAQKAQNLDNVVKSVFSSSVSAYIGSAKQQSLNNSSNNPLGI